MGKVVDVLVVGAGPAGATAALNLSPYRSVKLVNAPSRGPRVGESLLPAARRLLGDMGLLDAFCRLPVAPWYANSVVWESSKVDVTDFLQGPDGHGWHLDRLAFERFLQHVACDRGADIVGPAHFESIHRRRNVFVATLCTDSGPLELEARFVIDAGGRTSPVGRKLGSKRKTDLPLVSLGLFGSVDCQRAHAGITFIEAVEDGWWYTAPLPRQARILAFQTDADNRAAIRTRTMDGLLAELAQAPALARLLRDVGFVPHFHFLKPASGSLLEACAGEDWLSAGDASLTFDPLSSQGLLNALFLGLASAEAAHRCLDGDASATMEYAAKVSLIREVYTRKLFAAYSRVDRWAASTFWRRRAGC